MENQSQQVSQQPPSIPPSPNVTPLMKKQSKLPLILGLLILLLLVSGGSYYLGIQRTTPPSVTPSPTLTSSEHQITPTPSPSITLQTYSDPALPGFNLIYDSKIWLAKGDDVKACGEMGCSAPYGRNVTITSKNYEDVIPHKLALVISLFDADQLKSLVGAQPICFQDSDLVKIDDNWYRGRNPYYSPTQNDQDKRWDRYYYLISMIKDINGKKCIIGGLNMAQQESLPVKYNNKPTIIDVELWNGVSLSMESAADDIVKSIKFQ